MLEVPEVMHCVLSLYAHGCGGGARGGGRLVRGWLVGKLSLSEVVLVLLAIEAGAVKEGSGFLPGRVPSGHMP
jgi:hypothetical protein